MLINKDGHSVFLKATLLFVVCLFLTNSIALGLPQAPTEPARSVLAPPLATKPPCEIVNGINGEFTSQSNEPGNLYSDFGTWAWGGGDRLYELLQKCHEPNDIAQGSLEELYHELQKNAMDAIVDRMEEGKDSSYRGKVAYEFYVDNDSLALNVIDNGKMIEFDSNGLPLKRIRGSHHVGGGGQGISKSHRIVREKGGTITWHPLKDGTKVEVRIPKSNMLYALQGIENKFITLTHHDIIEEWDRETISSVKAGETLGKSFRNRWAFVDVGYPIAQMLILTQEHKLQNPKDILIPLIKKHIKNRNGESEILLEGFDIDGIEEVREDGEITGFSLPIIRNGTPAYKLIYNLRGGDTAIPIRGGKTVYVEVENVASEQEMAAKVTNKGVLIGLALLDIPVFMKELRAAEPFGDRMFKLFKEVDDIDYDRRLDTLIFPDEDLRYLLRLFADPRWESEKNNQGSAWMMLEKFVAEELMRHGMLYHMPSRIYAALVSVLEEKDPLIERLVGIIFKPFVGGGAYDDAEELGGVIPQRDALQVQADSAGVSSSEMATDAVVPSIYVSQRIFDQEFIEKEREISAAIPTVAFDSDETLVHYNNKKSELFLRPGIEEQLKRLKDAGIRLVMWTGARRSGPERLFRSFPSMAQYFDLVITRENFDSITYEEFRHAYSYVSKDLNIEQSWEKYKTIPGGVKNIKLFGYKVLVDNNQRIETECEASPLGPYKYYNIKSFYDDEPDTEPVAELADKILRLISEHEVATKVTHKGVLLGGAMPDGDTLRTQADSAGVSPYGMAPDVTPSENEITARLFQLQRIKDKKPDEITEGDKQYLLDIATYFNLYPEYLEKETNKEQMQEYAVSLIILTSAELASLSLPDVPVFTLSAIDEIGNGYFAHELGHMTLPR